MPDLHGTYAVLEQAWHNTDPFAKLAEGTPIL